MYILGERSKRELVTVNPVLQELVNRVIEVTTIDFGVLSGKRTAEEQKELYDKGFSRCDGYIKKSKHQTGDAVDLVPYIDGRYNWNKKAYFDALNTAIMSVWLTMDTEYQLVWGANWSTFVDRPHYELKYKL